MTSQGSLADETQFLPKDTLLRGPAGGVLACSALAARSGRSRIGIPSGL